MVLNEEQPVTEVERVHPVLRSNNEVVFVLYLRLGITAASTNKQFESTLTQMGLAIGYTMSIPESALEEILPTFREEDTSRIDLKKRSYTTMWKSHKDRRWRIDVENGEELKVGL